VNELVQADGDFDIWADLVEGLDKLPTDFDPAVSDNDPFRALIVVQRSEAEPDDYYPVTFGFRDHLTIRDKKYWFESRGYPVLLWTPPLPPEEAERYLAAISGYTGEKPWEGIWTDTNEDLLLAWGWIQ